MAWTDARGGNPARRQPMCVDGHPYYADLIETSDGVSVALCRADRPRGQRLVRRELFDAPMHVVADRVHALVREANRC